MLCDGQQGRRERVYDRGYEGRERASVVYEGFYLVDIDPMKV